MTKAILLDIEGTTTPIDFVRKTLFPFAKERIGDLVREDFSRLDEEISLLASEHTADNSYSENFDKSSPESIARYLRHLIDIDRKSTTLKSMQGKIWQQGYELGELKSEVFADVPRALEQWRSQGKTIAIYSSGSVLAQQLLFQYTDHGDLTKYLDRYFDTTTGAKRDAESYRKIAAVLEIERPEILFISDIPAELDAARASGLQTALSIRDGNSEITEDITHQIISSFDDLAD
jgi:enolase-phosphatase E1